MLEELQIRRPLVAAVYFGLYLGGCIAMFGAVGGRAPGEVLLDVAVALITATIITSVVNTRTRPELPAGLSAEQVRRVIRWVRHGEPVDDRTVAESVIVYARNRERSEPWVSMCFAGLTLLAFSSTILAGNERGDVLFVLAVIGACIVFPIEQRRAGRRRRAAEAAARSRLEQP